MAWIYRAHPATAAIFGTAKRYTSTPPARGAFAALLATSISPGLALSITGAPVQPPVWLNDSPNGCRAAPPTRSRCSTPVRSCRRG